VGDPDLVHLVFPLDVDEDGWPPVASERLWAEPVGGDTYRVDNTPWFVRDVAADDIVRAVAPDDGSWPVFVEKVRWSGNLTIRVLPFPAGALEGSLQAVLDLFEPLGAYGEGAGTYPIVALTVPPAAAVAEIHALLMQGKREGWWDVEEGCVDEAWLSLPT
jgi:hypothetical protein